MRTFGIISLGCSRNLVDSEVMTGSLMASGLKPAEVENGVDVCVVNTCAFIEPARKEAVETILQAAELKKKGKIRRLVVCGCLPQLYRKSLLPDLPEIDLILGTSDIPRLPSLVKSLGSTDKRCAVSSRLSHLYDDKSPRKLLTPAHYAYVKISEGCSNRCSYCIIPRLRGPFRSRSIPSVLDEVRKLSSNGKLKEINLIGQDTTYFGHDRYKKIMFPQLLRRLCRLDTGVEWIRILYTHPAHYSDELISTISGERKICKYLDLPVQHINDRILRRMHRGVSKKTILALIDKLRSRIPGLALRTSVIVGFPGETDRQFRELADFVGSVKFERLGAFIYSDEDATASSRMGPKVPQNLKKQRLDHIMKLQAGVSQKKNAALVGRTVRVLVDERESPGYYSARTGHDAPEVDQTVSVRSKRMKVGGFYDVKVISAGPYDLCAEEAI